MSDVLHWEIGFVYGIKSLDLIKIGVATDIDKRLDVMRLHNPHGCELVFHRRTFAPYAFEKRMHKILADKAVGREWFRVSLVDLRQAAAKARSNTAKATEAWESWQLSQLKNSPATQKIAVASENKDLDDKA